MKYKVGDRVVIKDKNNLSKLLPPRMIALAGKVVTIAEIHEEWKHPYVMSEDTGWCWKDEEIEGFEGEDFDDINIDGIEVLI